jgi:hypothetical protein
MQAFHIVKWAVTPVTGVTSAPIKEKAVTAHQFQAVTEVTKWS